MNKVGKSSAHPLTVELEVNSKKLSMEIDTGAVISLTTYRKLFSNVKLSRSTLRLRTVEVRYGSQGDVLSLAVVEGDGPSLFGRDWLGHVTLDWKTIGLSMLDSGLTQVEALKGKYKELFSPGIGTLKHFKARITVKNGARPVFHRPRSVPFALKAAIETELDCLEAAGVIEKVNRSDWAAPIVAVPKLDGRIRIYGDYKVTINPFIEIDTHPLPKPEDLFASLSGGQKFTNPSLPTNGTR